MRLKANQFRSSWHFEMEQYAQRRHQYMDAIDAMAESKQNAQWLVPSTHDEAEMSDGLRSEHVSFGEDGSHSYLFEL